MILGHSTGDLRSSDTLVSAVDEPEQVDAEDEAAEGVGVGGNISDGGRRSWWHYCSSCST